MPKVELLNDHSYVSLRSCIENFLMIGKLPLNITDIHDNETLIKCIGESKMANLIKKRGMEVNQNIEKEDLYIMMGLQWSDDCDPNNSIKSNRGSIWVKTLTIISQNFHDNESDDTYPISFGKRNPTMILLNVDISKNSTN